MPLLHDSDYTDLDERGLDYVEDETKRHLVFWKYPLPEGVYMEGTCAVLVIIPQNYNQAGIDMFWTHPHLTRSDGRPIPKMSKPGDGHNIIFEDKEFCRWSRHWRQPPVAWKPNIDNVVTILRRISWALDNPDTK